MTPKEAFVALAYARVFSDNPRSGDGETIRQDLLDIADGTPNIAEWVGRTGSASGHDISCYEWLGKRALVKRILKFASLNHQEIIAIERALLDSASED